MEFFGSTIDDPKNRTNSHLIFLYLHYHFVWLFVRLFWFRVLKIWDSQRGVSQSVGWPSNDGHRGLYPPAVMITYKPGLGLTSKGSVKVVHCWTLAPQFKCIISWKTVIGLSAVKVQFLVFLAWDERNNSSCHYAPIHGWKAALIQPSNSKKIASLLS